MTEGTLVLASRSPRRHALLSLLGVPFTTVAADVDESPFASEHPAAMVVRLSRAKAQTVAAARDRPGDAVLACDTMVALEDRLLGKPADDAEAAEMLTMLRGRTHQVYTAVSLAWHTRLDTRLSVSDVTFRNYSDDEMTAYIATGDPLDKAGAYAIQHPEFAPVSQWEGCYTGIMGLPLKEVAALLRQAGFDPVEDVLGACQGYTGRCCLAGQGPEQGE